jgi:predicted peroxiredoxin
MMKKAANALLIGVLLLLAGTAVAEQAKGLNVIVTSADRQAQMMAMVLSLQSMKTHGKEVTVILCASAGDLALQSTQTPTLPPLNKSPTMLLNSLLKMGATVVICPMYLPTVGKSTDDLIEGITVGKPPVCAGQVLNKDYQNLTF